jgi:hypothetical protein
MRESGYYPPGAEFDSDEIWKPIQGFEGLYEISNYGRVKSIGSYNACKRGIMNPMVDLDGYLHVRLYNDGISKDISVHRLVAIAFIPNPNNYKYVNHKDENTMNNSVTNLEWCTNSYNLIYSIGKKIAQYSKNGKLIKTFNSIADASREYNISTTNISKCCKGKRHSAGKYIWKYVR